MNARQLNEMKRGIKGAEKGLKMFLKMMAKAVAKGVAVPESMTTAANKLQEIIDAVNNATTLEEVLDAPMDEIGDIFETLQQGEHALRAATEFPKIRKQIDRQLKGLNKQLAKVVKAATRAKINVSGYVEEINNLIEASIVTPLNTLAEQIKSGEVELEDIFGEMQTIQEAFPEVMDKIRVLETVARSTQEVKRFTRFVTQAKRDLKRLERSEDVDPDALAAFETALDGLVDSLAALKDTDPSDEDAYITAFEELIDAQEAVEDAKAELEGREAPDRGGEFNFFGPQGGGPGSFEGGLQGFDDFMGGPGGGPGGPPPGGDF
ncbi:hypothetical protein HYW83_01095 [Candidatus Peregrinibacteria bacterium]|nr:hypothetical protein [Candidatus Peregrinibacteria bacterium]